MPAQDENTGLSVDCKIVCRENGYFVPMAESGNELDQIENDAFELLTNLFGPLFGSGI